VRTINADRIPIAADLPVMEDGRYVWPKPRHFTNFSIHAGDGFFTEGDCATCPRCGNANSTIAAYCTRCRALLAK